MVRTRCVSLGIHKDECRGVESYVGDVGVWLGAGMEEWLAAWVGMDILDQWLRGIDSVKK